MSTNDLPQIDDPGELNQRLRVQSINQARDLVVETYRELPYRQDLDDAERAHALRNAVTAFLSDIVFLVQQHGDDKFQTASLGEVAIRPPEQYAEALTRRDVYTSLSDTVEPEIRAITGIYGDEPNPGYLEAPQEFRAEWALYVDEDHSSQPVKQTVTMSTPMPMEVSLEAFKLGCEFLANHGLDAKLGEKDRNLNPV